MDLNKRDEGEIMPWKVKKGSGARPWKIVKTTTGEVVGSSKTRGEAQASVRARYHAEGGGEMTKQKAKKGKKSKKRKKKSKHLDYY